MALKSTIFCDHSGQQRLPMRYNNGFLRVIIFAGSEKLILSNVIWGFPSLRDHCRLLSSGFR